MQQVQMMSVQQKVCTLAEPIRLNRIFAAKNLYLKLVGGGLKLKLKASSSAAFRSTPARPTNKKLGRRWMEYQGIRNWEGLLDPLDDKLRGEILRYGDFVQAAYNAFDFDPSSPTFATCRFPKKTFLHRSGLPATGYLLTKYLRATCGVQVPRWMENAPSWMGTQSCWIGYVAVCQKEEEIVRLGRRDVVIAFRGTATCLEWVENLRATLSHVPMPATAESNNGPMVQSGFLSLYTSASPMAQSLQEMVRGEIERLLQSYVDEPLSITITGHSLGAALATLAAYDIKTAFSRRSPFITVISFGGPRVGNRCFRQHLEKLGIKVLRIVNSDDVITKVPGFVIDEDNDVARPSWIQKCIDTKWVYAEIGREFRVSSKDSPYLKRLNVAMRHDMKTYLHLVNGFVSSSCRFRATAKRVFDNWCRQREIAIDINNRVGGKTTKFCVGTLKLKSDDGIIEGSDKAREFLIPCISGDLGIFKVGKVFELVALNMFRSEVEGMGKSQCTHIILMSIFLFLLGGWLSICLCLIESRDLCF